MTEVDQTSMPATEGGEETGEEDENVYMMLFSPETTKEIKKARARVMKEEAEKKAAEDAAAAAVALSSTKPHSTSQVRFHDSTTFLQSPSSSFTAANIMRNLDSAKKAVTASSKSLAQRLIGISEKRKIHLSRRRNSIKEKTIRAASELVLDSPGFPNFGNNSVNASFNSKAPRLSYPAEIKSKDPVKPFKARPLPSSTGDVGAGGQFGVPKVNKRAATVPKSPMLGARRKSMRLTDRQTSKTVEVAKATKPKASKRPRVSTSSTTTANKRPIPRVASIATTSTNNNNFSSSAPRYNAAQSAAGTKKVKRSGIDPYKPFKARPLPNSNGDIGSGGQFGVPKIPKRPSTVPKAPVLGVVRNAGAPQHAPPKSKPKVSLPSSTVSSLTSGTSSPHFVKPSALHAQPFSRLAGGSTASNAMLQQRQSKIDAEEATKRSKANSFKARPLPATTMEPEIVVKGVTGDMSEGENMHPNAATGSGSSDFKAPSLKSTVRARQRATFEARKQRSQRARKAKMEMARAQLAEAETRELEGLREQIRMPR